MNRVFLPSLVLIFIFFSHLNATSKNNSNEYPKDTIIENLKRKVEKAAFNNPKKIFDLCEKGLALSEEKMDMLSKAWFLKALGNMYYANYNIEKATEYYHKAFKYLDSNNLKESAGIYISFGNVSQDQKLQIQYYNKALLSYIELNDTIGQIKSLLNSGLVYLNLRKYKDAKLLYINAIDLAQTFNDNETLGVVHLFWAQYYEAITEYNKSIEEYRKSLQYLYKTDNLWRIARVNNDLGRALLYIGENEQAIRHLNKSKNIANKNRYRKILLETYDNLSKAWMKISVDSAIFCNYYHNILQDSITSEISSSKLQLLQLQYEADLKENEIALLKQKKKIKNLYIALLIVILLIILFIIYLQRLNFKRKTLITKKEQAIINKEKELLESKLKNEEYHSQLLNDELKFKIAKFSNLALSFSQKYELLTDLKQEMSVLINSHTDKEGLTKLKNIMSRFYNKLNIEKDRRELDLFINEEYQTFSFNMKKKFPDLTDDEIKLSVYIVLGLSVKEVATIYNIIPDSVLTKRYRLRKKIGLTKEDNLLDYLNQILLTSTKN